MVRQQQDMFWDGRRAASTLGGALDWELVSRGFGVAARSVDEPGDLDDALAETLAEPGPALLRVAIAPDADCLPMFRPGRPGAGDDRVSGPRPRRALATAVPRCRPARCAAGRRRAGEAPVRPAALPQCRASRCAALG